ncbi:MAG: formylglycine-generating enzyme family protein [Holophagales bacterium]|nr:formylglycine-generating enzyme family protein [Holophagales bacterium]
MVPGAHDRRDRRGGQLMFRHSHRVRTGFRTNGMGEARSAGLVLALALAALAVPQAAAQELDADDADHPGRTFRDSLASGGDGPEMVVVPAGSFRMGCVSGVDCYPGREEPVHEVTIPRPFAVGSHEVTFAEWDACVSAGGCEHRPDDRGWGRDRRPVINVSWQDAQEYVSWLSGETGAAYRLPSEPEWEYAARAGSNTAYAWGDEIGSGRANCAGCRGGWSHQTAPAGSFSPNSWGLHDMHGNVWEWVEDCWHENLDGAAPDGAARQSDDCLRPALRGGCWVSGRGLVRAATRIGHGSGIRVGYLGFRVARTLAP